MPKLQLSFHGTFSFKKEDALKIIEAAVQEKGLKDSLENLQLRTGLGNRKVGPMKSWVSRAGLVENCFLSKAGNIVCKYDHYLESPLTDWFIHFNFSFGDYKLQTPPNDPADWGGWPYFIFSFLPEHRHFTISELNSYAKATFQEENPRSIEKNFKILLRAYTEPHALASCKFITIENNEVYQAGNAILPNPYEIGYFLAKLWERDYKTETSVLTTTLLNQPMGLGSILGLNTESLEKQLNILETYGILEQRRAVPPFQVIPRWDNPLTLLEKAYENER